MSRSDSPVSLSDRADVIAMIEDGWKDVEILECMPHIDRKSVTAFRAHVTRGTYSQEMIHGYQRSRSVRKSKVGV